MSFPPGAGWAFVDTGFSIFLIAPGPALPGDFNANGVVDAADYVLWRNGGPLANDTTPGVQPADYDVWRSHFGQTVGSGAGATAGLPSSAVPEPSTGFGAPLPAWLFQHSQPVEAAVATDTATLRDIWPRKWNRCRICSSHLARSASFRQRFSSVY